MLLRFAPVLIAVAYALLMWRFSVWRMQKMLTSNSAPLDDPELVAEIRRLATALELPQIDVRVFEVAPVNGLAAPDGRIFLTRGFLNRYLQGEMTAAEMASVVAHELGHVALGHLRRRMIDFTGQNAVFVMLTALLSRFLPFLGIWIANLISVALMARLSRRDEFEADEFAAALLIKAGIGTAAQKTMFRKLAAMTETSGTPAWLMTHPGTEERIAAIEAHEAHWAQPA